MAEQKQKQQKHSMTEQKEVPTVAFERPKAHGWYTVVFPKIHDGNTVLELWQYQVQEWLKLRGITKHFSSLAHGIDRKEQKVSPVYFFKEEMDAAGMMWRFNGELLK